MNLLQHGVDRSVIALWLGHESMDTTQIYLHSDLELKEQALAKTTPFLGEVARASTRPTPDLSPKPLKMPNGRREKQAIPQVFQETSCLTRHYSEIKIATLPSYVVAGRSVFRLFEAPECSFRIGVIASAFG
jgi:hypothetical protein